MINSRTKGAVGEREFASLIHQHLSVKLIRNLEQSRSGGHDLMVEGDCPVSRALDRFAIECKRYGSVTPGLIAEWWAQTESQARSASKVSCLAYRANRQDWRCVVPLAAVNPAYPWGGFDYAVDLSIEAFAAIVRESASAPTVVNMQQPHLEWANHAILF